MASTTIARMPVVGSDTGTPAKVTRTSSEVSKSSIALSMNVALVPAVCVSGKGPKNSNREETGAVPSA